MVIFGGIGPGDSNSFNLASWIFSILSLILDFVLLYFVNSKFGNEYDELRCEVKKDAGSGSMSVGAQILGFASEI